MVIHDEFAGHEDDARDLVEALAKLSRETQASPDFTTRVMAAADQLPTPRRSVFTRLWAGSLWPSMPGQQFAVVALCVLVMIGAVSQYVTWIQAGLFGVSSGVLRDAQLQEQLWQKNFECATKLDQHSTDYAAIDSAQVSVVTWACPSGDVLVTLESATDTDDLLRRSVWVAFDAPQKTTGLFEGFITTAFAATNGLQAARRSNPVTGVVCQKRLPDKVVKRRVRRANGQCEDEWIKTTTGKLIKRQAASCEPEC